MTGTVTGDVGAVPVTAGATVVDVVEELAELAGWIKCAGFADGPAVIASTPTPIAAAASTPPATPFTFRAAITRR